MSLRMVDPPKGIRGNLKGSLRRVTKR